MIIGILYICTGKYKIFWKDFYLSCEKNFIPETEKHYFVFTDSPEIEFEQDNKNIHRIYQENLGWPNNTMLRYEMFLKQKTAIEKTDFLIFFNANLLFLEKITAEEFLPMGDKKLVGGLHPAFYDKNTKSSACLNVKNWHYYYQGAINGGETREFIKVIERLRDNTRADLNKKIIALWHDESHWNKFLNEHQNIVKTLSPSFLYPEGFSLPFIPKILIRGKNKYFGGLNEIRSVGKTLKSFNLAYAKNLGQRIKNKIIYKTFSLYDSMINSYLLVTKYQRPEKSTEPRKISVAIANYNQEKIIHRSLKNILADDRIGEIIILDDGSNLISFEKTKKKLEGISPKINLFRRDKNLGILTTKIQAIELCQNDWVILLDSDNTVNKNYLKAIYNLNPWTKDTIYCPARPLPLLNFDRLSGLTIDFEKIKELLIRETVITEKLLNDGNFFLNKNAFLALLKKYEFLNPQASDVIFINYIWLSNDNKITVLPDSSYFHRIHSGGSWTGKATHSAFYFEEIKNKILLGTKEDFVQIQKQIPEQRDSSLIKKII
jgi:hypothetical protein